MIEFDILLAARLVVFVIFAAAGVPAMLNVWHEHGYGVALLLFGIYAAVVFIAVKP